jgi:hypothetical protein
VHKKQKKKKKECGIQAENGLQREEEGRNVERLEEDLCALFAVPPRVQGRLSQE